MNQLEANPQVTPVGQPFVVSQTVQPGIFWRRTCKCLGFSSYSLVYTTVCTTYNQGMPNRCIFFYLYQIGFYYCETILNSSYIQTFSYSHLPKSLSCVYPEQLDIVQLSGKVLPWGQFSSCFVFLPAILTEIKPNYYSQVYQGECHVSGLSILFPALP